MKLFKKAAAAVLVGLMVVGSVSACGIGNGTVAVSTSGVTTVNMDAYSYAMYQAYYTATQQVPDTSASVFGQQMTDKTTGKTEDATQWIRDQALQTIKTLMVVNDNAKTLDVSLSADDQSSLNAQYTSIWDESSIEIQSLMKCGMTYSGVVQLASMNTLAPQLFTATYGPGGPKAVSDADLKTFYVQNYADFSYYQDNTASMSDADKAAEKTKLDGYVAAINDGSKTSDDINAEIKKDKSATTDPLTAATDDVVTDASKYPDGIKKGLADLQPGKASVVEVTDTSTGTSTTYYVLLVKRDINAVADANLADSKTKADVLADMKNTEFTNDMQDQITNYTAYTFYDNEANKLDPVVFEQAATAVSEANAASSKASSTAANTQTKTSN